MMTVNIEGTRFELLEGDITEQVTDAIVNAAHWDLAGGQGTDGIIHYKGGPSIMAECRRIGGCPTGDAVITTGGNHPARFVIHTVGPVYDEGSDLEHDLLAESYRSSLRVAVENGLRSVAFPAISTGAFCFPLRRAAPIALNAIIGFLRSHPGKLDLVRLVLWKDENPDAYPIHAATLHTLLAIE